MVNTFHVIYFDIYYQSARVVILPYMHRSVHCIPIMTDVGLLSQRSLGLSCKQKMTQDKSISLNIFNNVLSIIEGTGLKQR